jgi:IS30 family transposase
MRYRHLIQEERYQISALHEAGWSQGAIAARLGRHASSISRELNRNQVFDSYQPQVAGLLALARSQQRAANARRVPAAAWQFAREKLAETWSPQQIAGHQRAGHLPRLSHEAIYQRIYEDKRDGGTLSDSTSNVANGAMCASGVAPSPTESRSISAPPSSIADNATAIGRPIW